MNRALLTPLLISVAFASAAIVEMASGEPAVRTTAAPRLAARVAISHARSGDEARNGTVILARPLFSSDRHPVADKPLRLAADALPRLSAILVSARSRQVVFDDDGKSLVAGEGGHAGPYSIMSIGPDRVTVFGPSGPRTLRPIPLASDATASGTTSRPVGLSLLQQLQLGQVPHYAVPPPPTISNLLARMRAQR